MRILLILMFLFLIPLALAETREKRELPHAIGFSAIMLIGAVAFAARWL